MLEQKTRVRDVEAAPLVVGERELYCITLPELDLAFATDAACPLHRFAKLSGVPLDAHDAATGGNDAPDGDRELTETTPHIEDVVAGAQAHGLERRFIEEIVQKGQPPLFIRVGAVNVSSVFGSHKVARALHFPR